MYSHEEKKNIVYKLYFAHETTLKKVFAKILTSCQQKQEILCIAKFVSEDLVSVIHRLLN